MNKRNILHISKTDNGIVLKVWVQPKSANNEMKGIIGDALGVRVTSPPIDNRANKACVELLAKELGLRRSQVEIINGHKSRTKMVRLMGVTPDGIEQLVNRKKKD